MNPNFDLNINNYSKEELEELLELPKDYDESIVEIKETKLRQNILSDKSIQPSTKTKTINFISDVRNYLVTNLKKPNPFDISVNIKNLTKTTSAVYNADKNLRDTESVEAGSTYVISKPATPYSQSFPSEYFQGIINPLHKRILRQNINIDTRFRDNYYTSNASNFHVNLPIRLTQVVSLQLSAMELPSTFYSISKVFGNNFFVLEIPGSPSLIVTIPDGNYQYISLQQYINNFLTTDSISIAGGYNNIQFYSDIESLTTSSGSGTGRMIAGSKTGTLDFSINFLTDQYGNEDRQTPLPLKLGWNMGFREGYYTNNKIYVSEGIINLLGPRYIYLVVDDFNNSVSDGFYGAFASSVLNKNILARISLQGNVFNYFSQNNLNLITNPRQYFGPVDIQKLQIQLLDEYGRILDLNNMDYSFCLSFSTIYDL
jgi:hypothetical protein